MSFENVVGGKLKLKGKALPAKGVVKKKKKSKSAQAALDKLQQKALRDAEAALEEEAARGGVAGLHETKDDDDYEDEEAERNARGREEVDTRTAAERRYHEQLEKIEKEQALKYAEKSHRQRIEEFNKSLASMTEHYDIPKVGPG